MNSPVTLSRYLRSTAYWSKYAGVRWTLVLSIAGFWFLLSWIRTEYGGEASTLWLVMRAFSLILQWTLIGLVAISVTSVLLTWGYFRYLAGRHRITVDIHFGDGQKAEAGWVPLGVSLEGQLIRPFFGTVHASLVFSKNKLSQPVLLDGNLRRPKHWWRRGIKGTGRTWLHDRGIHDVEHVLLTFTDMLSLVSLPAKLDSVQQVYTLPKPTPPVRVVAQPHSTEEQKHRIDVSKRVEGEYISYKEFESGDNIRRIVWKIYAKSGELVVRIPEIKDPYASHLYFYVSYFHGLKLADGAFEAELLNAYKDHVRNLYEALQKNGYDVRIPADQEVPKLAGLSEKKIELFQIAAANWHNANPPTKFVNAAKAAFVCLASVTPASEVAAILKKVPDTVPVVVVKLSGAIPSPFRISLKDIFFRPETKPAEKLSRPWLLSTLRRDLLRNEKEIESVVKQRQNAWMTEAIAAG